MVSESLDIQVLVRAMYDYESEDPTNLVFKKDDVIQVLAQLESGWWAGHCDGRQGWFPSNYVQVIGEDELDSQDEDLDVSSSFFLFVTQLRSRLPPFIWGCSVLDRGMESCTCKDGIETNKKSIYPQVLLLSTPLHSLLSIHPISQG